MFVVRLAFGFQLFSTILSLAGAWDGGVSGGGAWQVGGLGVVNPGPVQDRVSINPVWCPCASPSWIHEPGP